LNLFYLIRRPEEESRRFYHKFHIKHRCRYSHSIWSIAILYGLIKGSKKKRKRSVKLVEQANIRPRKRHVEMKQKVEKATQISHLFENEKEEKSEERKSTTRRLTLLDVPTLFKLLRRVEKNVGKDILLEILRKTVGEKDREERKIETSSLHAMSKVGLVVLGRILPYLYRFFRLVGSGDLDGDGRVTLSDVGMMSILVDKYCASLPSDVRSVVRLLLERFLKLVREKLSLRGFLTVGEFRRLVLIFLQTLGS